MGELTLNNEQIAGIGEEHMFCFTSSTKLYEKGQSSVKFVPRLTVWSGTNLHLFFSLLKLWMLR